MKTGIFSFKKFVQATLFAVFILLPANSMLVESMSRPPLKNTVELLMFEQEGCHYCQVWDDNIGVAYDKTPEGKFAPLRRVDIHFDDKVANVRPVLYTPTFVLYQRGREVGRVTGYHSDDAFWGLLEMLLNKQGYISKNKINKAG